MMFQDFMDLEYIPLETNDEFITQGSVMAIGNEIFSRLVYFCSDLTKILIQFVFSFYESLRK